ncbi:MAG: hypothetical protein QM727_06385 [Niabella sp.]
MKKVSLLYFTLGLTFLLSVLSSYGQNLIVNPSAEIFPAVGNGWNLAQTIPAECSGSRGWSIIGNQSSYPPALSGSRFFTPGCRQSGAVTGQSYELYQDVDVSANDAVIDAGAYQLTFSGWYRSFNQGNPDRTEIRVECRDASGNILADSTSGVKANTTANWAQYTYTGIAPVGTRTVRVRLIATSGNGSAIDSYFDDLLLTGQGILPVTFTNVTAKAKDGKVKVEWGTADEQNNSHFVVEASADGKKFAAIGTVPSKAKDGNSSVSLQYAFSFSADAVSAALTAIALLGFLLSVAKRGTKKIVLVLVLGVTFVACNKRNIANGMDINKLLVRVAQVDKDGTKKYSKTVKVVTE